MAKIWGCYVNLVRCEERRQRLERNLKELGIAQRYERFRAISGDEQNARDRGLNAGEFGIWQTWLELLSNISTATTSEWDYLHVLEDDAEISSQFIDFCDQLSGSEPVFDLLVTDMYVNPSIHRTLAEQHDQMKRRDAIKILRDVYSGCLSSVMIHRDRVTSVLRLLEDVWTQPGQLLPLDNTLRRLLHEKRLSIARTAPFLTSVREEDVLQSSIQPRQNQLVEVVLTQALCTHLRRQLSTLEDNEDLASISQLLIRLSEAKNSNQSRRTRRLLTEQMLHIAEKESLLMYARDPRLDAEPDNGQLKR